MKKLIKQMPFLKTLVLIICATFAFNEANAATVKLYGGVNGDWNANNGYTMTESIITSGLYYYTVNLNGGSDIYIGIAVDGQQKGKSDQWCERDQWYTLSNSSSAPKIWFGSDDSGPQTFFYNTNTDQFKYQKGTYTESTYTATVYVYDPNATNPVTIGGVEASEVTGQFCKWKKAVISGTSNPISATISGSKTAPISVANNATVYYYLNGNTYTSTEASYNPNAGNSYTIYVATENMDTAPYLFAWDDFGNPLGDWPGTQGSTTQVINGYTWYKFTISDRGPCQVIVHDNNGNQTADLGPYSADRYIVFDPNKEKVNNKVPTVYNEATVRPEAAVDVFMIGYNGDWTNGTQLTDSNNDNTTYSITDLVLHANSYFRIRTSEPKQFGPTTDGTTVTSETTYTMTETSDNAYKITADGVYTVEVNRTTPSAPTVKLTKTGQLPLYIIGGDATIGSWTPANALAMTTTDGINYTAENVTLQNETQFIFANVKDSWDNINNGNRFCPNTEDAATTVAPGSTVTTQATTGITNSKYVIAAGSYDITFNRSTLQFTFTPHGATINQYVLHVIDKSYNARTPYIYAWDSYNQELAGNFPGTLLNSNNTVTLNGETWYKITLTSYSSTISAIASAVYNEETHQTSDITGIAPGNYYIVFDSDDTSNRITPSSETGASAPEAPMRGTTLYLMHNHSGSWNITTGNAFNVTVASNYAGTLSGIDLTRGTDYFFFATKTASGADSWSDLEGFRFGPTTNDDAAWPGVERTAHKNTNSYTIGKTGTYSFAYSLVTNNWTPTLTAANSDSKWYMITSSGADNFDWSNPKEMTRSGNNFSYSTYLSKGDYVIFAAQTGNDWNSAMRYTCNGETDETIAANTTYTAVRNGGKAYHINTRGTWTFTYNYLTDEWSATCQELNTNTGELYMIGMVANQKWDAHAGLEMTKSATGNVFTIERVQIVEGASFSFTTKLGENAGDWNGLRPYRVYPQSDGNFVVTDNYVTNSTPITLADFDGEINFMMAASGTYNVSVDLDNMTVTFSRPYQSVYMIGNVNGHATGNNGEWNATQGTEMRSTDGKNYLLNVSLNSGETFSFSKVIAENDDEGGWTYVNGNRYYTDGGGELEITHDKVNTTLTKIGSYSSMKMMVTGNFIVTFNINDTTLYLKETYAPVANVKVLLEQTPNVTDPRLSAFDKLRKSDGTLTNVEWPDPDSDDVLFLGQPHINKLAPNAENDTTSDGRVWWVWNVPNSIADVVFYRSGGSVKNNDTQWRIAGEHYYTWEVNADESAFNEHTREYFHASASGVAECANMWEGHYYVYYTNTASWNDVHVHYWYDSAAHSQGYEDSVYPGPKATLVGYDDQGFEVWLYDFGLIEDNTSTPIGILFNNGDNNDATKQQTGNFDYSNGACYDFLGSVYLGQSLANIIANGEEGPRYTIEDELVAVYYNDSETTEIEIDGVKHTVTGALYVKDNENYLNKSLNKDGKIDYIKDRYTHLMGDLARYDQSNWVKIVKSPGTLENVELAYYVGKVIPANSMKGKIVNKQNPEIHIDAIGDNSITRTYSPNVYITCHFNDDYVINNNGDYFFVKPKPQEYAHIIWAVYDRNEEDPDDPGRFYVPASNNISDNAYNLEGGFRVDWSNYDGNWKNNFLPGNVYEFDAIIRYVTPSSNVGGNSSGAPRRTQHKDFDPSNSQFMVYPLSNNYHDDTLTGVMDTVNKKTVIGVTYYNLMGVESREPFSGVNIVVTHYSDGSTTSRKVLK